MQWLTSFFWQEISSCQKCIWETARKSKNGVQKFKETENTRYIYHKMSWTRIQVWCLQTIYKKQRKSKRITKKQETPDTYIIYQNELDKLCFQGVSQKFPIWAVLLLTSELWSRGFGEQGSRKILAIWHLRFFISNSIFRVNIRLA